MRSEENQERYGEGSDSVNLDSPAIGGSCCTPRLLARGKNVLIQLMHWDFALILLVLATLVPLLGRRRIRRLMEAEST
ncbi:MAG TPA: hypothetical protein VMD77_13850, partial [Candidatus Baltobacteraceae bacterium]|nr:hypothetical protein [Candidatus Baltobacteraceae bacterium]